MWIPSHENSGQTAQAGSELTPASTVPHHCPSGCYGSSAKLNQGLSTPVGIKLSFRCGPTRSYHVTLHILYCNDLCHWQGGSLANRCAPPCSPTFVTQTSPFFPSIGKAQFLQFPLWELVPAQNMQHPIGDLELILRSL